MSNLIELQKLLESIIPNDNQLFVITCSSEFEPHGRASETWEIIWRLSIPKIPHHWLNLNLLWVRGKTDKPIEFTGRTIDEVVLQALNFVRDYKLLPRE